MKPDAIKVGSRINFIRKKLGLTMQEFGHKVSNSPRSTVSTWEHGGNLPSKEKMSQIAKLGQVNEDWIKWGDFEEYINEYISFLGYSNYISNRQYIADIISKDIQKSHSIDFTQYSLDEDYSKFNRSIEMKFKKLYLEELLKILRTIFDNLIHDNYSGELSDVQRKKIFNNFYDDVLTNKIDIDDINKVKKICLNHLRISDTSVTKKKYSSVEDFFYKITKNQFETEKFISDLSKKYNFPYEKNSIIAKFLTGNHDKFKNN